MEIIKDDFFWSYDKDEKSSVFQIFPDVHVDERGSFSEQWKLDPNNIWIFREAWTRQVNISKSGGGVLRGCHAQSGSFCQAKLVTSIAGRIFDIITDMRPQSNTFGKTKVYFLNPNSQNKLFVPRGFLHAFLTGEDQGEYIFQYMCDNVYSKEHEVKINPNDIVAPAISEYCGKYGVKDWTRGNIQVSEADANGKSINDFFQQVKTIWDEKGILWYDGFCEEK